MILDIPSQPHDLYIYGANHFGKVVFTALAEPGRVRAFVDNGGASSFMELPVCTTAALLGGDSGLPPGLVLCASTAPSAFVAACAPRHRVCAANPAAMLLAARAAVPPLAGLPHCDRLALEVSAPSGLGEPVADTEPAVWQALFALKGAPRRHIMTRLRDLTHADRQTRPDWRAVGQALGALGYSHMRMLLMRLALRLLPDDAAVVEAYVASLQARFDHAGHCGQPARASRWARRILGAHDRLRCLDADGYLVHKQAAVAAQARGDFVRPMALMQEVLVRRTRRGDPPDTPLFLAPALFTRIGSTLHVETLLMSQRLDWSAPRPLVCLHHDEPWGNEHLVRRYLARDVRFLPEAEAPAALHDAAPYHDACFEFGMAQHGRFRFTPAAACAARAQWAAEGRAPLYRLDAEDRAHGDMFLSRLGYPAGTHFVTLHVRSEVDATTAFRNSRAETLMPAVDWLIGQGLVVVRLGDPGLPLLPPKRGLVDLDAGHAGDARLNVFFLTACRFFVGTNSGPVTVPLAFGVPVVYLNASPVGAVCGGPRDTYLPKLALERNGETAGWARTFCPAAAGAHFQHQWDALALTPVPNQARDILEAVQWHAYKSGLVGAEAVAHLRLADAVTTARFRALTDYEPDAVVHAVQAELSPPFAARFAHLLPEAKTKT